MLNNFICPKCRSELMIGGNIILSAKAKDNSEGLIKLSPKIGDYTVKFPATLNKKEGELLTIFCPVCHQNLASSKHINLAMVIATDETRQEFEILFSQIVGEHSTVKIIGDNLELYGEDAYKYQDHFNNPRQMF